LKSKIDRGIYDSAAVSQLKALLFDVFGTVVDWRSSLITELSAFGYAGAFGRIGRSWSMNGERATIPLNGSRSQRRAILDDSGRATSAKLGKLGSKPQISEISRPCFRLRRQFSSRVFFTNVHIPPEKIAPNALFPGQGLLGRFHQRLGKIVDVPVHDERGDRVI